MAREKNAYFWKTYTILSIDSNTQRDYNHSGYKETFKIVLNQFFYS